MNTQASTFKSFRMIIALVFSADPWRTLGLVGLTAANSLTSVFFALALKFLTDGTLRRDSGDLWLGVNGMVLTMVIFQLTNWSSFNLRNSLQEKTTWLIDRRLIELSAGLPGLEHHERPDYITELELLRQERHQLAWTLGNLVGNFDTLVQGTATMVILATLHPILLLLPLFAVPSLAVAAKAVGIHQRAMERSRELGRTADHLFEVSTTPGPAKETRIFSLASAIIGRHASVWKNVDDEVRRADYKVATVTTLGWFFFAIGYIGAMAFVVQLAVARRVTPGDVLLAFTLGAQVNQQVSQAVGGVSNLIRNLRTVGRYIWLVEYAKTARPKLADPASVPARLEHGIDLEGVAFKYPGTDAYVLERVDLHIPAGATVAIVGENGAGKTTLVKLLCRFYEPTEGRILVDGTPLDLFPIDEWRSTLSGAFQDFARFEFIAGETVGVGDIPHIEDLSSVERAVDRAGATEVIAGMPDGLGTQLGKSFGDGVELSGGQWQKLALSRAMMRTPLLLVLDEPTASLDANTEHALFEQFAAASERASKDSGAITVLVSHRFSTVRMADIIVVIDGGRMIEVGSHDELMAREGVYAELYELQARAYR